MKKLFILSISLLGLFFGMVGVKNVQPAFAEDIVLKTETIKLEPTRETTSLDTVYDELENKVFQFYLDALDYNKQYQTAQETADVMAEIDLILEEISSLSLQCYNYYEETSEERFIDLYNIYADIYTSVYQIKSNICDLFTNWFYYDFSFDIMFLEGCIDQVQRSYKIENAALNENKEDVQLILETLNKMLTEVNNAVSLLGENEGFSLLLNVLNEEVDITESLLDEINEFIQETNINKVLADAATLNERISEMVNNYKDNYFNYNGDIKECENLENQIHSLIAKIDADLEIKEDDRIKEIRVKLVDDSEIISKTRRNIKRDHAWFLALVIACPVLLVIGVLALLYFFGFKKRFLRKK